MPLRSPPQKVIMINPILTDFEESELTSKEKKRKIKHIVVISQVLTSCPAIEDDLVIGFQKNN